MIKPATAKIFMSGRSQAVRLPKAFRLPGKEVHITKKGDGVLLEPIRKKFATPEEMWAAIDAIGGGRFDIELPDDPPPPPEEFFGSTKP